MNVKAQRDLEEATFDSIYSFQAPSLLSLFPLKLQPPPLYSSLKLRHTTFLPPSPSSWLGWFPREDSFTEVGGLVAISSFPTPRFEVLAAEADLLRKLNWAYSSNTPNISALRFQIALTPASFFPFAGCDSFHWSSKATSCSPTKYFLSDGHHQAWRDKEPWGYCSFHFCAFLDKNDFEL